jgi:hypothetical protein
LWLSPDLDPITGPEPSTLTPALLAERLASERALREQSLAYERELRAEGRASAKLMTEQMARSHESVHRAEATARDKAEGSVDKRLEGMNQFRDQLREQAGNFLQITVFEAWKEEYRRAHDELRGLIIDLQKADLGTAERRSGVVKGQGMVIAAIVGSVSLVGTILGIIIVLANVLTKAP